MAIFASSATMGGACKALDHIFGGDNKLSGGSKFSYFTASIRLRSLDQPQSLEYFSFLFRGEDPSTSPKR